MKVGRLVRRLLVLAVVLWLGYATAVLLAARADVQAGRRAVDQLRHRRPTDLTRPSTLAALRRAEVRLGRAHRRIGQPALAPARVLPLLGTQLRSAEALAGAGSTVASVARRGATAADRLLNQGRPAPDQRVALLNHVAALAQRLDGELRHVRLGPHTGLVPPLAHTYDEAAGQLAQVRRGLQQGAAAAHGLAGLLTGPRHYLVFAANNGEMRAGAGMFLSVGQLEVVGGRMQLTNMQSVTDVAVPPGAVPLTGDLAARWGWLQPNVEWRNLMASPRFDVAAPLAAQMWVAAGGAPVDGVLALDPVALKGVLAATGPVPSEDGPIGADNVVDELLHHQYFRYPNFSDKPERREALGGIAAATVASLNEGGWVPAKLADGLASAARGRHILAWSARGDDQRAWRAAGLDGSVSSDSVLVAVLNRGGNKLDQYLRVHSELRLTPHGSGTTGVLRVKILNDAPTGQPAYVTGPYPGSDLREGEYRGILTVTLPQVAQRPAIDGVDTLAVAGADGPTVVVGAQFDLDRNQQHEFVVRFQLPVAHGQLLVRPSGRVPATAWTVGAMRFDDDADRIVSW